MALGPAEPSVLAAAFAVKPTVTAPVRSMTGPQMLLDVPGAGVPDDDVAGEVDVDAPVGAGAVVALDPGAAAAHVDPRADALGEIS